MNCTQAEESEFTFNKGGVQRLPEVRDALGNASLKRLTVKQQLCNLTLPTRVTTIIYNKSPQPDSDDTILY